MLLIVEGQLKSLLKPGVGRNAGLMRPVGGKGGETVSQMKKTYCVFIHLLLQRQGTCSVLLFVAGDGSETQPNLSVDQRNTCGRSRECCLHIQ